MATGIKIMLSGHDQSDAHDQDIAFQTNDERLQLVAAQQPPHFGVVNYTFPSNPAKPGKITIATIVHNLGYVPASAVFMYINAAMPTGYIGPQSYYQLPIGLNTTIPVPDNVAYFCDSTQLQIYFQRDNVDTPQDLTGVQLIFKYYIFANNGA